MSENINYETKLNDAKKLIEDHVHHQQLPASTVYILDLEQKVDHETQKYANEILKLLQQLNIAVYNKTTLSYTAYNTAVQPAMTRCFEQNISGYNLPTKRLFVNTFQQIYTSFPKKSTSGVNIYENKFVLSTAITNIFNDCKLFTKNLSFENDNEITLRQNVINNLQEKLNSFLDKVNGQTEEFINRLNGMLPKIAVKVPPQASQKGSKVTPKSKFWQSVLKKIQDIPDHDSISKLISTSINASFQPLNDLYNFIKEKGQQYKKNNAKHIKEDLAQLKHTTLLQCLNTYGFNNEQNKTSVQQKIDLNFLLYQKDKDKPYEDIILKVPNVILSSLTTAGKVVLEVVQQTIDKVIIVIGQLFEWLEDLFFAMMDGLKKPFDTLLKVATPPGSLDDVLQWAINVAALFNKPLVDAATQVVQFVTWMTKIITTLIKKLASSKSLLLDCGPKLAGVAASLPITSLNILLHYMDLSKVKFNLGDIKLTSTGDLSDSLINLVKPFFNDQALKLAMKDTKNQIMDIIYPQYVYKK